MIREMNAMRDKAVYRTTSRRQVRRQERPQLSNLLLGTESRMIGGMKAMPV